MKLPARLLLVALLVGAAGAAFAQNLPTSQPQILKIYREEIKPGRSADHARTESGWPVAYEKANSPYYYLGMTSLTGLNEAWFVVPFESYAAMADAAAREAEPALAAELSRLSRADGEMLANYRVIELRARADLSHGAYPDLGKQRFWEISIYRVRPGQEEAFAAAAKAYGVATSRSGAGTAYRVYEVTGGMPGPAYFVFSSVSGLADFDKMFLADQATMKGFTPEDMAVFKKFSDGLVNHETHRFQLSPEMSYVPKATRAQDPAFWTPKKPVAKPTATAAKPSPQQ
jgi:hypothetical protein